MMPKNNPKAKQYKDAKRQQEGTIEEEAIEERLPSDSSSQTDEDILTLQNPDEERTVESERPDGDMRK